MPALQTRRSTSPASLAQRSTSSRFETSPTSARPPMSRATVSTCFCVRPVTRTRMPAAASSRAMFSPIPRPPPVTRALPDNGTADLLQALRVLERRQVAGILSEHARTNCAADDLCRPRLRQRSDPENPVGLERLAERIGDGVRDTLVLLLLARFRHAEDPRHLALHRVRHADRCSLRHDAARDRGRLELRRPDPLACDVQRVVGAAVQIPVAVLVDRRPVAMRPHAREALPVRLEVALVVAPDSTRHARPWPAADQLADLTGAHGLAGLIDDVHVFAERGEADRDRLDRLGEHGGKETGANLRSAAAIHDWNPRAADPVE